MKSQYALGSCIYIHTYIQTKVFVILGPTKHNSKLNMEGEFCFSKIYQDIEINKRGYNIKDMCRISTDWLDIWY